MESPTLYLKGELTQLIYHYINKYITISPVVCDYASVDAYELESGIPDPQTGLGLAPTPPGSSSTIQRGKCLLGRFARSSAHGDEPWRTEGA